ncbi:MAG: hypothetical protein WBF17_03535 [Phycisphaerae bacterium]
MPPQSRLNFLKLAEDVVSGEYTYRQIGRKYGVSSAYVSAVVRGKRCPRVAELIAELDAKTREETARRLARLAGKAVDAIEAAMHGKSTSVALAAAKEVLRRTLDREQPAPDPFEWPDGLSLMDLSPETKRRVVEELGGPVPPDEDGSEPCGE